jgi:hypothetical protein
MSTTNLLYIYITVIIAQHMQALTMGRADSVDQLSLSAERGKPLLPNVPKRNSGTV